MSMMPRPASKEEEAKLFAKAAKKFLLSCPAETGFTEFRALIYNDAGIDWNAMERVSCPKRKFVYVFWRYMQNGEGKEEDLEIVAKHKNTLSWDSEASFKLFASAMGFTFAPNRGPKSMMIYTPEKELKPTPTAATAMSHIAHAGFSTLLPKAEPELEFNGRPLATPYIDRHDLANMDYAALELRAWADISQNSALPSWRPSSTYGAESGRIVHKHPDLFLPYTGRETVVAKCRQLGQTEAIRQIVQSWQKDAMGALSQDLYKPLLETLNMDKPFETRHYSYGTDVSKLSDQNLIAAIKTAEGELASLRTIAVKSATIKGLKASLKTAITNLAQALDKTHNFTEGTTMNEAFKTVNYVYGNDINTLSTNSLIAAIKRAETERGALDAVQADSKKIEALKAEITAAIAKMVEALDART